MSIYRQWQENNIFNFWSFLIPDSKHCRECHEEHFLIELGPNSGHKYGRHNCCPPCKRIGDARSRLKTGHRRDIKGRLVRRRAVRFWSELKAIGEIYREAKRLTKETGIKYQVHHMLALQSEDVCGLHVAKNLVIITAKRNQELNNHFSEKTFIEFPQLLIYDLPPQTKIITEENNNG